ncbi:MAG: hypothetical protein ABIR06_12770 [Cyclobacteriaceae bacterium]
MKSKIFFSFILICTIYTTLAQSQDYAINTVFSSKGVRASGAYGALSNKFTSINGQQANLVEVYGGWYVNHKFLLGLAFAGVTNDIPVAPQFSALPGTSMSYEYGQVGLMTEYVIASNKAVHLAFQLFSGAGLHCNTSDIPENTIFPEMIP